MIFSLRYDPVFAVTDLRRGIRASQTLTSPAGKENDGVRRRRIVLKTVDKKLLRGKKAHYESAVELVTQLQGKPGGLIGFGAAKQVPMGISSLKDLNITEMEISSVEGLVDSILEDAITCSIQPCELSSSQPENSLYFERNSSPEELLRRVVQHEAGHFLAAYLLGIVPNDYRLASVRAMKQENVIKGDVQLPAFFMRKVDKVYISRNNRHKEERTHKAIKSKESFPGLKRFACVTLGGIVAEHLEFGDSNGGSSDIEMLYGVYRSLGFTADEAYSVTKWGALNTMLMLHRHGEARSSLAEAMAQDETIGFCIDTIENNLNLKQI